MKPLWIALAVVGVLCCGGVTFLGYQMFSVGKRVVEGGQAYGDASLKSIAAAWNPTELKSRMAKEVFEQNPEGAIDQVASVLGESLGPIKPETLKSSVSGIEAKSTTKAGSFVLTQYRAEAEFEKGPGEVTMELIQRDGQWRIMKFNGKKK